MKHHFFWRALLAGAALTTLTACVTEIVPRKSAGSGAWSNAAVVNYRMANAHPGPLKKMKDFFTRKKATPTPAPTFKPARDPFVPQPNSPPRVTQNPGSVQEPARPMGPQDVRALINSNPGQYNPQQGLQQIPPGPQDVQGQPMDQGPEQYQAPGNGPGIIGNQGVFPNNQQPGAQNIQDQPADQGPAQMQAPGNGSGVFGNQGVFPNNQQSGAQAIQGQPADQGSAQMQAPLPDQTELQAPREFQMRPRRPLPTDDPPALKE